MHGEQYAEESIRRLRYALSHAQGRQLLRDVRKKLHQAFGALDHEQEGRVTPYPVHGERPIEGILRDRNTVEATIYVWIASAMKRLFSR